MDTSVIQKKLKLQFMLLFAFCSCVTKDNSAQHKSNNENFDNRIHVVSHKHYFSSPRAEDNFRVELIGNNVIDGQIKFEIFNSLGEQIFSIEFESKALLDYSLVKNPTDKNKADHIIKRMDSFFEESNFLKPAIDSTEIYDEYLYTISGLNWSDIKNDQSSIGFYYLNWEENQTWIVYDKKSKVVVKYR